VPANLAVGGDGLTVTGTGTPGSTVNVYGPNGVLLGSALVAEEGTFTVNLATAQADGETLQVGAVGGDGSASLQAPLQAPDITAPLPLTQLALSADGLVLTGRGEAGATVTVLGLGGLDLGESVVNADGTFSVDLAVAQINGEVLSASQSDVTGNESNSASLTAPDRVAPDAPLALAFAAGGTLLSGTGEAGSQISVLAADGTSLGAGTVRGDGTFQVTLTPAQANGETLRVLLTDAAGNQSEAGIVTAADTTAPVLLSELAVAGDGSSLTGRGEVGAEVSVVNAADEVVGTATVDASGHFSIVLDPPLGDAQVLRLTQTDAAGNVSSPATLVTPDFTPPAVLTNVIINADGSVVSGNGEAGATVTVSNAAGAVVGTSIVLADGTFRVELDTPQINQEPLSVQQADPPGNVSDPVGIIAPDLTPPAAPTDLRFNADGTQLGGTGEAGTTVVVTTLAGVQIGTGTVSPNGTFAIVLDDPQLNGEQLLVTLVDASDNVSPETPVTAVDSTSPLLAATLNADGTQLSGTSEAGAQLTVLNDSGDVVGEAVVDADGTFVLPLTPAQQNGQLLTVIAQDATGNPSIPVSITAPDITAPAAPAALLLAADGVVFTGTGEAGSIIQVRGADGVVIGEGEVAADGNFSLELDPPQVNGESLTVIAVDQPGNESLPQTYEAADSTPPDAVTNLAIDPDYTTLAGRGQPGARVTVTQDGEVLGEADVAANGTFVVQLDPSATPGGELSVVQADAGGDSPENLYATPLERVPDTPVGVELAADGVTVTGTAAAGTDILINDADGNLIIAGVAGPEGTFTIVLPTAQLNGELLNVVATSTGGDSQPFVLQAADVTAPDAPVVEALSANGLVLTGTGEAGATVTVTGPDGVVLGSAVVTTSETFSVNLSSPQLNGQVLSVTQADAVPNTSGTTSFTAPDVQAPTAPTALALDAGGLVLTGSGEPGATVTVRGTGPDPIGTGTVGVDGRFSVTLDSPQLNGQVLSVRLTDAATNTSGSTSLTAPDTTPPVAPVAAINANGTAVSGTGQAGATVTVTNATTGAFIASAVVGSAGTYVVSLPTAQINFEALSVTQSDAGGTSPVTPLTAPDFTAPVAASNLLVNADGTLLTGAGEVGATVSVRLANGTTLTTTVAADGTFSIGLPAQDNGQIITVNLTDPRNNVSADALVIAPDIDADRPVTASDNLATASVVLAPVVSERVYTDSFTTLLSGFTKTFTWTVAEGTTADPVLTLTTSSALALLDGAVFTLQVKDASGAWVTLATGSDQGVLDLILLPLGQGIQADFGTQLAGDYRLTVGSVGIGLVTTVTTSLDVVSTSLTQFTGTGTALDGNVLTDPGVDGLADVTGPDNGAVVQVLQFGNYVNAGAGVTVQGLYGTLVLRGDGSYTYTPNASASSVGKVDVFSYQLVHPNGLSDTASLYVRIDNPNDAESWSNANLAAPAVVVDAINDVDNVGINLVPREATSTATLGTLSLPVLGSKQATYTTTVAADTTADLQVVLTSNNILALLNGATIELLRLNPATGQYVSVQTVGGGSLISLLGNSAGYTFQDQVAGTYHIRVTAGGIGLASSVTTSVNTTTTFNNELVVGSYTPVIGNLISDTTSGSEDFRASPALTVLSVLVAANTFVNPGHNGVSVVGTYGTLYVQADGTYSYLLKTGLTSAVIGQHDTFTYELTHPNGTSDIATLTINLDDAAAITTTAAVLDDTSGSDSALLASFAVASVTGETLAGTDGNDRLDGSQGGPVTLQGGAGDDTLVIVDQDFTSVDGGSGTDTLLWAGGDASIDLGNLVGRLHDIDVIDLNDTSAVSLTLSLEDVIAVTDPASDTLVIKGGAEDSVTFTDNWTLAGNETADGVDYIQYVAQEDPSHHLWVQNNINVV
ncbi:MAG TPA: Ig-like domain-containing protein, partial [Pseudomonas sp.]|uniref:BapA/Bap/LapF family large adhesin n=1 Tax=Pseudomonas sp. TaxID=306 RepID=UPI002B4625A3